MPRLSGIPVLVLDGDPSVIEDFAIVLGQSREAGDESNPMGGAFETELLGSSSARGRFPEVELSAGKDGPMTVEAGRRAVERGQPYRIAFIDIGLPPGHWGLDIAAALRALDPKLHIVLTISEPGPRPFDICEQVAPADRLSLLHKPLRAPEIEQLILAAEARHARESADELARSQARGMYPSRTVRELRLDDGRGVVASAESEV